MVEQRAVSPANDRCLPANDAAAAPLAAHATAAAAHVARRNALQPPLLNDEGASAATTSPLLQLQILLAGWAADRDQLLQALQPHCRFATGDWLLRRLLHCSSCQGLQHLACPWANLVLQLPKSPTFAGSLQNLACGTTHANAITKCQIRQVRHLQKH